MHASVGERYRTLCKVDDKKFPIRGKDGESSHDSRDTLQNILPFWEGAVHTYPLAGVKLCHPLPYGLLVPVPSGGKVSGMGRNCDVLWEILRQSSDSPSPVSVSRVWSS